MESWGALGGVLVGLWALLDPCCAVDGAVMPVARGIRYGAAGTFVEMPQGDGVAVRNPNLYWRKIGGVTTH